MTDNIDNEKYKRHLENVKKANKKYREKNKDYFSEYQRNYYHKNKDNPEYMQKQREKALKAYYNRKLRKQMEEQTKIDNMQLNFTEIYVQNNEIIPNE
jgi:hypothetical protein